MVAASERLKTTRFFFLLFLFVCLFVLIFRLYTEPCMLRLQRCPGWTPSAWMWLQRILKSRGSCEHLGSENILVLGGKACVSLRGFPP